MSDDLFDPRLTEHRNPRTARIDRADTLAIVDLINAEDSGVPAAVHAERERIATAVEIAVECFRRGGRLIYVGAGTSGRLGVLDATECPPTFGTDPELVQGIIAGGLPALTRSQEGAEDRAEDGAAAMDEKGVKADDFIFGIATSSTTPYVRGALRRAAELGARTGFLCCTEPDPEMRELVNVCIVPLVGPEVVAGSTRMKAGTATKLVLNTITTGAMIRLGKVYGNLMVDLRAMSEKLVDRSQRIVMAATGRSRETATALLEKADGSVKHAIVMDGARLDRPLAALLLSEAEGHVWRALERAAAVRRAEESGGDPYADYPSRPPDAEATATLVATLRGLPDRLGSVVGNVPDEKLRRRPAADSWCAKEHMDHLIDADEVMRGRVEVILEREAAPLADRDDQRENRKSFERAARDARAVELLDRYAVGRKRLVSLVDGLSIDEWSRCGNHERYGPISVYQLLRHVARHDHHHLSAIRALVEG